MIDLIDYLNLMELVKKSWKVITDSAGLQKEAYFAKKKESNSTNVRYRTTRIN